MPELPEVEVARRAIEEHCLGKTIKAAQVANDSKVIDGISPADFEASLLGKTLISARRKGKNLWLQLDSPPFPSFQFGMAGAIHIKGVAITTYKRSAVKDTDEWPSKYSKLFLELDDGLELSFVDKRRFARVRLLDDPTLVPPISELGPDALFEPMVVDEFYESVRKKKIGIKALLLDQSFISGIGNWIADEVLYQARIHPLEVSSSLSEENCATLHKCIKEVTEKAVQVGADTSLFSNSWIFHFRETKPTMAFVDGKKIDFIKAGGRTTAFVPELQKLYGIKTNRAVSKAQSKTSKRRRGMEGALKEEEKKVDERSSEEDEDRDAEDDQKQKSRKVLQKYAKKKDGEKNKKQAKKPAKKSTSKRKAKKK